MDEQTRELPQKYHQAVVHWQQHNFPDYPALVESWDRFFPKDPPFCLCARIGQVASDVVEYGDRKGQPKATKPTDMDERAAKELFNTVKAQASTEFGSIQQHQGTLARAYDDQDRAWVLRVMAEELRHGYQMVHLITNEDWSAVSGEKADDTVEHILSSQTGSHYFAAFNLEFDSFLDNIMFAAFIDRVGKYQLTMQKVSAYRPYAESMPPMLREEAFHLAAGVMPLRRWVERAAKGDPLVTMAAMQKAANKWFSRGLEMFGFEKEPFSSAQVNLGLKDRTNADAQQQWIDECAQMLGDLSRRYVRARLPGKTPEEIDAIQQRLAAGESVEGIAPEEMLRLPDRRFFRRSFDGAYEMVGIGGETFADVDAYVAHLAEHLPEAYLASRDMRHYIENLRKVVAGELTVKQAVKNTPKLQRLGSTCPCSNSVRWVMDTDVARLRPAPDERAPRLRP